MPGQYIGANSTPFAQGDGVQHMMSKAPHYNWCALWTPICRIYSVCSSLMRNVFAYMRSRTASLSAKPAPPFRELRAREPNRWINQMGRTLVKDLFKDDKHTYARNDFCRKINIYSNMPFACGAVAVFRMFALNWFAFSRLRHTSHSSSLYSIIAWCVTRRLREHI